MSQIDNQVEKVKVVDSRIVQPKARYAINTGATDVSNVPFQASSNSSSTMSYNIHVPSQNVFMDRTLSITTGVLMKITVQNTGWADGDAVKPVLNFGSDCSLPAFPLQSGMSSLSATINNSTVTANHKDILYELLRLTNMKKNHKQRTTPTTLDKYALYTPTKGFDNSPINGFNAALSSDNVPNGAFGNVEWVDANGNKLDTAPVWGEGTVGQIIDKTVYYKYTVTEKLVLSPFIYDECEDDNVGLYGINNIQVVCNFGDQSKSLRIMQEFTGEGAQRKATRTFSNLGFASNNPFIDPVINCVFRTPAVDVPLPEMSIVPYMETPRYITAGNGVDVLAGESKRISSSTIVLTQIPDLLLIYCKPNALQKNGADNVLSPQLYGDMYLPIDNISMNFQNRSGIMSSMTREQLFEMSVKNNLDMDYNQWLGKANVNAATSDTTSLVSLVGGFLVLRPGVDFALSNASAPGLGGSFTLQFNVNVNNQTEYTAKNPSLFCVAINSGFFVSKNGSSYITSAPVTERDIVDTKAEGTTQSLERYVGGSFWNKIGSTLKKITGNPAYKAVSKLAKNEARKAGDTGKAVSDVADALGLGRSTGGKGRNKLHSLLK